VEACEKGELTDLTAKVVICEAFVEGNIRKALGHMTKRKSNCGSRFQERKGAEPCTSNVCPLCCNSHLFHVLYAVTFGSKTAGLVLRQKAHTRLLTSSAKN